MRHIRTVPIIIALAAVLAACSSTSTATAPAAPGAATPAASAPAPASAPAGGLPAASPVATAGLTCTDADLAAAHLVTDVHYLSLNVGTTNDSAPTFADLAQNLALVQAMAPQCAAAATDALATFAQATDSMAAVYAGGNEAAVVAADKAALTDVKDAGVAAWTAMAKDPAVWDNTLAFTQ